MVCRLKSGTAWKSVIRSKPTKRSARSGTYRLAFCLYLYYLHCNYNWGSVHRDTASKREHMGREAWALHFAARRRVYKFTNDAPPAVYSNANTSHIKGCAEYLVKYLVIVLIYYSHSVDGPRLIFSFSMVHLLALPACRHEVGSERPC